MEGSKERNVKHYSENDVVRIREVITEGVQLLQEIEDLSEGLRDTVKSIAEEIGVKPAQISKAIRICHKRSLAAEQEKLDEIIDLIQAAGLEE
jgi:transposase-like protein